MAESTLIDPEVATIVGRRVSPAQHLHARFAEAEVTGNRGVRLSELPFLTMVGLRVRQGSLARAVLRAGLEARLGTPLPTQYGKVAEGADVTVLWLSPDEFLLVSAAVAGDNLVEELSAIVAGSADAVVDLSANRTTFVLEGPAAREVLEKGCPLDLHPRTFTTGTAVNTNLGRVPVILHQIGADAYRIFPRSSFADHLGRWLIDAMAEFKVWEPS